MGRWDKYLRCIDLLEEQAENPEDIDLNKYQISLLRKAVELMENSDNAPFIGPNADKFLVILFRLIDNYVHKKFIVTDRDWLLSNDWVYEYALSISFKLKSIMDVDLIYR